MKDIGLKIRELRENAQLTSGELCRRSGVSPSGIASIEKGDVQPRPGTLRALAVGLGLSPDYFLDQKPEVHGQIVVFQFKVEQGQEFTSDELSFLRKRVEAFWHDTVTMLKKLREMKG